jgi:FtsZ-interacting cell division protein YlmF
MGFFDELRKLTQPYDDDNDYFDGSEFNEPSQPNLRASSQPEPSATQKQFESMFGGGDGGRIEPEAAPKEDSASAQPSAGEAGASGGGLFGGFGFKKAAKPRRERLVNVGGKDQQVILFNPKSFDEAGELVAHLEQNRSVVMTLEGVQNDFARRLLDFLSGITFAMHGKITPISAKTYFVTPQNVDILGAQAEQAESAGQSF